MSELRENTDLGRYEIEVDGQTVFARHRLDGDTLTILWVESPPALRGTGAAGKIMTALGEKAQQNGWRIVPVCGYAAAWLRGSKTYRDLVVQ